MEISETLRRIQRRILTLRNRKSGKFRYLSRKLARMSPSGQEWIELEFEDGLR